MRPGLDDGFTGRSVRRVPSLPSALGSGEDEGGLEDLVSPDTRGRDSPGVVQPGSDR